VSWGKKDWADGDQQVTARDLLARTVLYKVGHHDSHNATLNGLADGETANLGWMAQGKYDREFTAMITEVRAWAETQKGWDHPLKAIKDALLGFVTHSTKIGPMRFKRGVRRRKSLLSNAGSG
jgi:hypothetical protein